MNRLINRLLTRALCAALLLPALLPGALAEGRQISLITAVTKWGQLPQRFEIAGQALPEGVGPEDFAITGRAYGWEMTALHDFAVDTLAVETAAEGWSLVPDRFPDKYFYVRELAVTCERFPELSFALEDIAQTYTRTADDFETVEEYESRLDARVFTPEPPGPLPLVICFHGYGDTNNLLTCRNAVAWAEPEAQAQRPCTVIAPVIPSGFYASDNARRKIFAGLMRYVEGLIDAGQVDPKRIYAMGNSFGGMAALELAEQYPERVAAVLSLCPASMYFPKATALLYLLKDIPVTVCQAESDETIPVDAGRAVAKALTDAGNEQVTLRVYTDEEMFAAGAALGYSETYSFHHVELAVMEDETYAQWLFSQSKP